MVLNIFRLLHPRRRTAPAPQTECRACDLPNPVGAGECAQCGLRNPAPKHPKLR